MAEPSGRCSIRADATASILGVSSRDRGQRAQMIGIIPAIRIKKRDRVGVASDRVIAADQARRVEMIPVIALQYDMGAQKVRDLRRCRSVTNQDMARLDRLGLHAGMCQAQPCRVFLKIGRHHANLHLSNRFPGMRQTLSGGLISAGRHNGEWIRTWSGCSASIPGYGSPAGA